MKRKLFPALFLCSCVCMSLSAKSTNTAKEQHKPSFHSFTGKILGDKVRLRLHPNLDGHIVKELSKGEIFAVVNESEDYYAVSPQKDMKAYVYRTYILDNQVEAEHVNVRLQPHLEAPIVAQLNSGDRVDVNLTPEHSKWFQISIPKDVVFWVAKEYVDNVGPIDYVEKYHQRVTDLNQRLATAELVTQTEFRKGFQEIDIARLVKNYQKIAQDYPEMDHVKEKTSEAIAKLEKEYCEMKIAYLEGKAGQAVEEVETLNAKLTNYDKDETDPIALLEEIQSSNVRFDSPKSVTDKMKVWEPLEKSIYQMWASNHPGASVENFYGEEALSSGQVSGIVESFNTLIKNKPGDFVLTNNGQTVAYLYSTHVNLQDLIGKKVSLKVSERDNHNFAFPAYYVLEAQD